MASDLAPTGKAAARLTESLGGALQKLPLTGEQLSRIVAMSFCEPRSWIPSLSS
ncbi:hypothetical protein OUHCRE4_49640 [Enterobacter hormaechei subsp. steigerwaltii]